MSSIPPNMPPHVPPGGPYSSYDAKAWHAQQKAAWRTMKAQQRAWKAQYGRCTPSVVGPILQISVGVIALLITTGRIDAGYFWSWFGHWWPLLLIATGIALLGEWAIDMRRQTPVRRSGGFWGILILLVIVGLAAAGWNNFWGPFRAHFGDQSDDFFNSLGLPEHDNDRQISSTQIPAHATIQIENPRGDISITASDGQSIEVQSHEVAYTRTDADARRVFDAEAPGITVNGNSVLIRSAGSNNGRVDLTISVPKSAHISVNADHGDVTASSVGEGFYVNASQGDVHLSAISGSVQARLSSGHHDFSAHQIAGDLTLDGACNDLTLSEIQGRVTQNGEILGDVHMENVSSLIHLHTSLTDLQVAQLTGDLSLNSDELRVNEAKGQVRVTTKSRDIDLSRIQGDTYVETRNGNIAIEPDGNYAVEAKNSRGDVEVTLPANASAQVNASVRNGDILSDFASPSAGDGSSKSVSFSIGGGKSHVVLSTENGDVHLKKGNAASSTRPETGTVEKAQQTPKGTEKTNALHLKSTKKLPAQPTAQ